MVYTGDEGIKRKFFYDLKRLFPQTSEVDVPLREFQNVGLNSNQIDSLSNELSSDGDETIGQRSMQYPIRPDAEDCSFFIRTGTCKFGSRCKFNHPVLTKNLVDQDQSSCKIPCKFYMLLIFSYMMQFYPAGLCKYGESCRFNHSKSEAEESALQLNIFGFPKRLVKMNCSFYIRTGMCGYGAACRFNHPDPVMVLDPESMNSCKEAIESTQSCLSLPLIATGNFPFVHQNCVLSGYQAPKCKQKVEIAECTLKREPCVLNDVGLPIRPGKKACRNYENLGLCKFGRACAYDHPKKHSSTYGSTSASHSGVKAQENCTPEE
ncbi:hypothetical protein L1987_65761 [Smallanthus sonchifolius]|uniref:Uncharacterized protein n=1 Tax=Smallanthus sonchifolius TaxID=185202 RepID=A0ACB9BVH2_9ASTR|nr:hypothetical protein L1987_65761 [Smallanthus sonchifolius]